MLNIFARTMIFMTKRLIMLRKMLLKRILKHTHESVKGDQKRIE